jgi:hypothetical protein
VYLTASQLNTLADESGRFRSLVLLLGVGGLRWGEAAALRVSDIDFLRRRIELHRNAVQVGLRPATDPSDLEAGLANDDLGVPLAEIDDPARVAAMVKPLYAVLDDPQGRPWNVHATTLSKVLHRKRPKSIVLHDKWVNTCYVGGNGPVKRVRDRSWADYMVAITLAIGQDIRTQWNCSSYWTKPPAPQEN